MKNNYLSHTDRPKKWWARRGQNKTWFGDRGDGLFCLECWVGFLVVLFNFLSPSFNWKNLFAHDFDGDGGGCFCRGGWTELCPEGGWQEEAGACGAAWASRRLWEGVGTRASVTEGWRQRKMGTVSCDSESHWVGQDQAVKQGPAYICCCENNKIEADREFVSLSSLDDFQWLGASVSGYSFFPECNATIGILY